MRRRRIYDSGKRKLAWLAAALGAAATTVNFHGRESECLIQG
jgi:hypothetical protein